MPLTRVFLTASAILAVTAGTVLGQAMHTRPADRNAALAYSKLFVTDMPKELTEAVEAVDVNELGTDPTKQAEKYKAAVEQIAARQGCIRRLMEASRLSKCDFEIAYEDGFNALLPHLGSMRKAARLLRFDARRLLIEGKPDEAAERVAAVYRMAAQMKNDGVLISALVSAAMASVGNSESGMLVSSGKLSATGRETIVKAIEGMGRSDPFGVKKAVQGEKLISSTWVRTQFVGKQGVPSGKAFAEAMTKEWGLVEGSRPELNEIAKMDDAAFVKALDQLDQYHELMQTQWDLPDAAARLEVLASRVQTGDFGPFAAILAPSLSKARAAQTKAEDELLVAAKRLKEYTPPASNPK